MSGHPEAEAIADHLEGLLPDADAARVEAHLVECGRCARTRSALQRVTAVLAADPAPPMPAAVADRLDAALLEESDRRAGTGEVKSLSAARAHRSRVGRALLAAAAAVVVVASAGVLVDRLGGAGSDIAGGGAGRAEVARSEASAPLAGGGAVGPVVSLRSDGFGRQVETLLAGQAGRATSPMPQDALAYRVPETCADDFVSGARQRVLIEVRPALLGGRKVALVVVAATPTAPTGRAYAVRGCGGPGERVLAEATVSLSR